MVDLAVDRLDGKVIGGYHLLERVGRGGMAWVYKAASLQRPEQSVAVKFLNEDSFKNPTLRSRFRLEYKIHKELDHPNIVKAHQILEEDGLLGYVMDWIQGETFRKRFLDPIRPSFISREEIRVYFLPLLDAIDAAHQKGFLHRDLKPSNLMIVQHAGEETPKVLDFGIGKDEDGEKVHTGTGEIIGSCHYMAPEQIERSKHAPAMGRQTDVYQLGAVLFHLITRHLPFKGNTANVLLGHTQGELPDIFRYRPELERSTVGPLLKLVIEHAMEKDPANRFASCASFREYLSAALRGDPLAADFEKIQRTTPRSYSTPVYGDEEDFDAPQVSVYPPSGIYAAPPEFKALAALSVPGKPLLHSVPPPQSGYSLHPSLSSLPPSSSPTDEEHEFTRHVASLPQEVKEVIAMRNAHHSGVSSLPISSSSLSSSAVSSPSSPSTAVLTSSSSSAASVSESVAARLREALASDFSVKLPTPPPASSEASPAEETTESSITKPNGFEFQKTQRNLLEGVPREFIAAAVGFADTHEEPIASNEQAHGSNEAAPNAEAWDTSTADFPLDIEKTSLDRQAPSMQEITAFLAQRDAAQQSPLAQRDAAQQVPLPVSEVALDKTTQDMRFPPEELARFLARQPSVQDPHASLLQGQQVSALSSQPQPSSSHASDAPIPAYPPTVSHPSQSPPLAAQGISMRVVWLIAVGCLIAGGLGTFLLTRFWP